MADFYMHYTLAQRISNTFELSSKETLIGAQGPDYFFYVLGKMKDKALECGQLIHTSKTKMFLVEMLKTAIEKKSIAMRNYLIGFLTHHALDTRIHPYIFYYTGLYDETNPETSQWAGLHLEFERKVDIAFIKDRFKFSPHKKHLMKKTLPLKQLSEEILTQIETSIKNTFNLENTASVFNQGYKIMKKVGRFVVFDPLKIKRKLIGLFESKNQPKNTYYQDLSHAQNTSDFDYLNLTHETWYHPVSNTPHQESVNDLFNQAFEVSKKWAEAVIKGFKEQTTSDLENLLEDASYDTGLPWNPKKSMTYFFDYRKKITP